MEMVSGADTTEIEIGVPLMFEPEESPADLLPMTECKEAANILNLPGMPAERASGTHSGAQIGNLAEKGLDSMTPATGQAFQKPAVQQAKAVFAFDDADIELDETIIITAPFDMHSKPDLDDTAAAGNRFGTADTTSRDSRATAACRQDQASTAKPGNNKTASGECEIQEDMEEPLLPRKGFFRRLLGAMCSPFRRRKPADL